MSLLNQVLQDLDDRDQPRAQKPVRLAAAPEAVAYVDDLDESDGRDWVRIGAWSAVGATMMLAAWIFHDTDRDVPVAGAPIPPVSEVTVPVVETLSPAPIGTIRPPRDSSAATVDPVPALSPDTPAEMRDGLPEPVLAGQAETGVEDPVVSVEAQPVSSTGAGSDITNGNPAQTAEAAEDHYLPLRNTELPVVTESRPAKTRRVAPSSASVKTANSSIPEPLEQIRQAIEQGELAKAEHLLDQRLAVVPKDLESRELLIGLMLRGERYDSAGRQLDQALAAHPGHSTFVLIKARMLAQQGETDAAINILEGAPAASKGRVERLQMLGALYQHQSRYDDALQSYRALLALTPDSGPVWVGLAISLDGLGDAEALDAYTRALQLGGLPAAAGQYARQRAVQLESKGG